MSDDLQPLNWLLNSKCPDINYAETNIKPKSTSKKSLDYILRNARNVLEDCRTTPTIRPPLSYATLILLSLNATPGKTLTLSQIYKWIRTTFKYYENTTGPKAVQWKNSIRHNLSLNKCFVKVPRGEGERGKGGFWTLDKQCERKLVNGENFYRLRKRRKTKVASICREEVLSTDGQECLGVVDWSGGEGTPAEHQVPANPSPDTEQHDSTSFHSEAHSVEVAPVSTIQKIESFTAPTEFNPGHFQLAIPLDETVQAQFVPSSSPDPISGVVHLQEMTAVEPLLGTTVIPLQSLSADVPEGQDSVPYYELLPVEWTFELYGDPKGACFDFPGLELDLETWIG